MYQERKRKKEYLRACVCAFVYVYVCKAKVSYQICENWRHEETTYKQVVR